MSPEQNENIFNRPQPEDPFTHPTAVPRSPVSAKKRTAESESRDLDFPHQIGYHQSLYGSTRKR